MRELIIQVKEIRGKCDVYKLGDRIVIKGPEIDMEKTDGLCIHALPSLLYYSLALREGADPVKLGLSTINNRAYLSCPDPGPPYTQGGNVVFELILEDA